MELKIREIRSMSDYPVFISSTQTERLLSGMSSRCADTLREQTIGLERSLRDRRMAAGITTRVGCGNNYYGIFNGGFGAHLIEHAICAVLENNAPIYEASVGVTTVEQLNPTTRSSIAICPPPSLGEEQVRILLEKLFTALFEDKEVDLGSIKLPKPEPDK